MRSIYVYVSWWWNTSYFPPGGFEGRPIGYGILEFNRYVVLFYEPTYITLAKRTETMGCRLAAMAPRLVRRPLSMFLGFNRLKVTRPFRSYPKTSMFRLFANPDESGKSRTPEKVVDIQGHCRCLTPRIPIGSFLAVQRVNVIRQGCIPS